jgi:protoheme ferro-lyase
MSADDSGRTSRGRVLILALTYGEPSEARFADQFAYSLLILRRLTRKVAPLPRPILPLIALMRARSRVRTWRAENFSSPLEPITQAQVEGLAQRLRARDTAREWDVRPLYEFRRPLLPQVLEQVGADPPDRLLLMPLYLADCDFTSGVSQGDLRDHAQRRGAPFAPTPEYVSRFSEDDRLVDLMERFVHEQIAEAGWSEADRSSAGLLLGVHGTLVKGPPGVDTGLAPTQSFHDRLSARLAPRFAHASIGWLNHTMGGEWTSPDLETAAREMAARGIRRAVYYPFGFLADNAESQLEGRTILRQFEDLEVLHLPCLNTWPPFLDHLADRVIEQLNGVISNAPREGAGERHLATVPGQ